MWLKCDLLVYSRVPWPLSHHWELIKIRTFSLCTDLLANKPSWFLWTYTPSSWNSIFEYLCWIIIVESFFHSTIIQLFKTLWLVLISKTVCSNKCCKYIESNITWTECVHAQTDSIPLGSLLWYIPLFDFSSLERVSLMSAFHRVSIQG